VVSATAATIDCRFADVERADPKRSVVSLPAEFGVLCGVGAAAVARVSGVASDGTGSEEGSGAADCSVGNAAFGCCIASLAAGGSVGAAAASAADTRVCVGVASADAMASLLDGVELVCAPPELWTIPERGSAVAGSLGGEVELAWPSTELCTVPAVESGEEPAAEGDVFVADFGPVDDGLAADSDDELEADEESDDELDELVVELEELESVGSANASPGVFAMTVPMPSATANAPTRPTYCAFTAIPRPLAARPYERRPISCLSGLYVTDVLQYPWES
jgi:hypothetical protein